MSAPTRPTCALLGTLLALLLGGVALATTYRELSPSEIFELADVIFSGRVLDVTSSYDATAALPGVYTTVTFAVDEVLGGSLLIENEDEEQSGDEEPPGLGEGPSGGEFTLRFLGGEDDTDRRLLVAGSPTWRSGENVLVAALHDDALASPVVGFRQGLWRLSDQAYVDQDGVPLAVDAVGRPVRSELPGVAAEVIAAVRDLLAGELPASDAGDLEPEEPPAADADGELQSEPGGNGTAPGTAPGSAEDAEQGAEDEDAAASAPEEEPLEPVRAGYRVEDSGGPLLLSEQAAVAAGAWRELEPDAIDLVVDDSSDDLLAYGPEALFAPGTASLTLVGPDGVRYLFSPSAGELLQPALLHELGLVLGLAAGGPGVMGMGLSEAAAVPGAVELAELAASRRYAPADLSRDGVVDFLDLLEFSRSFGVSGLNLAADLDGDGDVDEDDLALLEQAYELTPPRRGGDEEP